MLKHKDNRTLNKSIDLLRIFILSGLFGVVILLFLVKLFDLQVLKGDYYASVAVPKTYKSSVIDNSRGQIYDRNGNVLVSNKKTYNISIDRATLYSRDYNTSLIKFLEFCENNGIEYKDNLPVSTVAPFETDDSYIFDNSKLRLVKRFLSNNSLDESVLFSGLIKV